MVDNTEQQAVPVAQEDREAAADLIELIAPKMSWAEPWLLSAETWRRGHRGRVDCMMVPEAFARHRLARLTPIEGVAASRETWATIAQWCEDTFGPVTMARTAERANEEMQELLAEPDNVIEAADVCIVLSRYPGLWDAVQRKMAINRARTWDVRGDGTGYHVKAPATSPAIPEGKSGDGVKAGRKAIARIIRGHMPSHWCDEDALRTEAFSTALADVIVDATQTREAERREDVRSVIANLISPESDDEYLAVENATDAVFAALNARGGA